MKNKIEFDRLVVGGILKFGKLDSADITLIMRDIDKVFEVELNDEDVNKYFIMSNGSVVLNEDYLNSIYKNINSFMFERMSVNILKRYFDNLDVEDFVLRKIKLLGMGCIPRDDLIHNFSIIQLYAMKKLYQKGYVIDYLHEDSIYGDYQAVKLTKSGLVKLFTNDNYMEIEKFYKSLIMYNCDVMLFDDFLMNQDLEKDIFDILTIDNYLDFCRDADRGLSGMQKSGAGYSKRMTFDRK